MEEIIITLMKELQELKKLTLLNAKKVLNMDDVASLTGLKKSYLYKKVMNKEIPYYKSDGGKITYFDKEEIENWCLKHRFKPSYEIEQEAMNYCVTGNKSGLRIPS